MEKSLAAAFIVAGRDFQIKIKDPSAATALCTYIAVHHAWDAAYPPAYYSTLSFIDKEVWGTPFKQPVPKTLASFYREFINKS